MKNEALNKLLTPKSVAVSAHRHAGKMDGCDEKIDRGGTRDQFTD